MDYEKEVKELNKTIEVFKPEAGSYKILIANEPEETYYEDNEGNKTPQIKIIISTEGKERMWYVAKGKTFNSVYGQLMLIGKQNGKLLGQHITLLVKRSAGKNEYTISEAIDLIPKEGG